MKKKVIVTLLVGTLCLLFPTYNSIMYATDYASNEGYYQNLCNTWTNDPSITAECAGYRSYLSNKSNDLQKEVASMDSKIASIQNDINSIQKTINDFQVTIDAIDALIVQNDAAILQMQGNIVKLETEIVQTTNDIEVRDKQIKERMVSEQASLGTNVYVEFIMGSSDLVELMRIVEGLQRITQNDQEEIVALDADRKKLDQQKSEQTRLQEDEEIRRADNEKSKADVEEAKAAQERLVSDYRKQEASLLEEIRSKNAAISAISSKIIAVDSVQYQVSDGWMTPVNGRRTAGTFHYAGGGFHGGLDFAASIGTAIVAPIGGVVVYANNPFSSNSGYLGNYVGHPSGAGNSVHMVGTVNGTTYGISFFHMAQENFVSYAGKGVSQGTVIGSVGHSGNSTGAHCHVEIINLGGISTDQAIAQFRSSGADFSWGTGWSYTSTTCEAKGSAPCRERPESFF